MESVASGGEDGRFVIELEQIDHPDNISEMAST
jgi:hypothetical protein